MGEIIKHEQGNGIQQYNAAPFIDAYLAQLDVKPRTRETYGKAVRYFFDYLAAEGITAPTRADVIAYRDRMAELHSTTTAASYLTAVRSFCKYMSAETNYPNIAEGVKNPRNRRAGHLKDALSAEQAGAVLRNMPRDTTAQKRDYAIITLLTLTGLRTIEIERANVEDVRSIDGVKVLYVWGKGRDEKDEYVKLTKTAQAALDDYLAARRSDGERLAEGVALFASVSNRDKGQRVTARSVSRIAKNALRTAGLDDPRLTAHSFRHTAVTLALKGGATIRDAQQMARHGSVITTERYAHDLRRLEAAAEDAAEAALLAV